MCEPQQKLKSRMIGKCPSTIGIYTRTDFIWNLYWIEFNRLESVIGVCTKKFYQGNLKFNWIVGKIKIRIRLKQIGRISMNIYSYQ